MFVRCLIACAATCLAVPAAAERLFVNDPQACAQMGTEDGLLDFAGEGGLILDGEGFSSLEYFCSFQPSLAFKWDGYNVSTHVGQCETPGPFYSPQLFTFVLSEEEPGVVVLYDGADEPTRFYSCTN